ncbi:MAG: class II D-tagatose-bisphosphate aldolase, non-catalytic subunit [Treponema sp.]|jgi:D-tagatose-1,6-bisphosphate aldolase subunit GatZ/KbaZ|nr:class II D-tagatose-bisphosphate aldolase, non-catalytic subunit [Treponema sp.]
MANYLKTMVKDWHQGKARGIMSACTASAFCIEAVLLTAQRRGLPALIEATANQVNQFGGYIDMCPSDYYAFVMEIAGKIRIPPGMIILGGDHLGPLPFKMETSSAAMRKAEDLVRKYVKAGFGKIHIDTSMRLGDDDPQKPLPNRVIAERAARLAAAALAGFEELQKRNNSVELPVFVIGSDVPVPGGAQEAEANMTVTTAEDLENTIAVFKEVFTKKGLQAVWDNIIGVVIQSGAEFGDSELFPYDREKTRNLTRSLKQYDNIVLEGHSTDYQCPGCLRNMVQDGICILKVGPALTFYKREALFALSAIERELLGDRGDISCFPETLEKVMLENPADWIKYYRGTEEEQRFKRKYSYSDRSRYYFKYPQVINAIDKLIANLSELTIPITLLSQFMPIEAAKVREGLIEGKPRPLILSRITDLIDEYVFATAP